MSYTPYPTSLAPPMPLYAGGSHRAVKPARESSPAREEASSQRVPSAGVYQWKNCIMTPFSIGMAPSPGVSPLSYAQDGGLARRFRLPGGGGDRGFDSFAGRAVTSRP